MKKIKVLSERKEKEIKKLIKIYLEIRNDPVAMKQAKRLLQTY